MSKLVCDDVSVDIAGTRILDGISFTLESGAIVGLIGPNGSGKTTLLNVISGIQRTSSGRVQFGETQLANQPRHIPYRIGIFRSFQQGRLFESLTAEENIAIAFRPPPDERICAALVPGIQWDPNANDRRLAVNSALRAADLESERNQPASEMSYGIRKRTILGQANIANSVVCLLDEPLAGIDPGVRDKVISVIASLRHPDRVVLLVEHDFDAVQKLADRVLLLDRGRLVKDGTVQTALTSQTFTETYLQDHGD